MSKRTCYLGGPMRGHPNFNFQAFFDAARHLRSEGWTVISPAEMDIEANEPWIRSVEPLDCDINFPIDDGECRRLIRRDVDAILTLRRADGDAVIMLDGYGNSVGASAEVGIARWAKLPVYLFEKFGHTPLLKAI